MGTLRNGIAGNYRGKIGNLIFYEVKGRQVVRTVGKSTVPPTPAQLQNRNEMEAVVSFLRPLKELISIGFNIKAKGTSCTPYNMAVSYNKIHAVKGAYPNVTVAYEKVLVTEGKIREADDPMVELKPEGLRFSWFCPAHLEWPRPNDQVILLAYFPKLEKAEYLLYGPSRMSGVANLPLSPDLLNAYMEVYISFIALDRKQIANSCYLGNFNL
ncbi:hypothetical protein HDC92_000573 [Pedobacter sp. AK017]|uniref:DUF6266 family protein n=1 Tax=Pedobacter sp. AK017 TaxID=2723073 RepID=UPI00161DE0B9|nr:DUF6266 family protein [Pedobacter sp. AK017]MBB5436909.1 hypothetical protein [Pedobacter sp. AK017]